MRRIRSVLGFFLALFIATAALASDQLLVHGHIYTGNPKEPWAQAVGITGSRIDFVGTDEESQMHRTEKTTVVDLQGRTVIPGISDSHLHMWFGALALHGFNLSTPESSITPDNPVFMEKIKAYAAAHPAEKILFGRADFSTTPPSTPTYALLDSVVTGRPVIIHHTWEHALWLNSAALALTGINDQPVSDPLEEKNIIRDANGHPSGVLLEAAMAIVERALIGKQPQSERLLLLQDASHYLNSYGITSVVNATGDLRDIEAYGALRDQGRLTVRTRTSFGAVAVNHRLTPDFLKDLERARNLYHDDWVSANLVKFFVDGGTGLIPPLTYQPADYKKLVAELDKRGFQIMTHTLRGDSAKLVLDAYEEAEKANGKRDRRFRIEHASIFSDQDLPRIANLSAIASMQPTFCCTEIGSNYDPQDKTPTDRWHTLSDRGVVVAFGSDWPCTWPPNPFVGMQEAVTREIWRPAKGSDFPGGAFDGAAQAGSVPSGSFYVPEETITVQQAVDAYTRGSAYASFAEKRVGTLEVGKEADLAVLSQDIFSIAPTEIGKTKVVMTLVGGKTVFRREN